MTLPNLLLAGAAIGAFAAFFGLILLIVWLVGPGREIVGADAQHGQWVTLTFRAPSSRAYRVWARVFVDGDEDSSYTQGEVTAGDARGPLQLALPNPRVRSRYWAGSGKFTTRLATLPAMRAGDVVQIHARVLWESGPAMRRPAST